MTVRDATPDEHDAVMGILDAAMLDTDPEAVRASIESGNVLVAVADDRVLGALVLEGERIEAVAVRRNRRGQGLGSALVTAAFDRRDRLVAECDERVRPFYESLGFAVEPVPGASGRLRGVRE
ncbi:GNAT family N-acetyltransferase [Haloarculaceae archaeon H-GB11]|nr:GNAT family N-acetyltransferase [Haloarculaceae archaeon H-GB11]